MRILVVDDDLHSREGLREWLRSDGHTVVTAADGWHALGIIREHRFEIAIIDLDLPAVYGISINGWDLARIFRAYDADIGIVVVSAEDEEMMKAQARQFPVTACLEKPVSPARLKDIVKCLGQHPSGREAGNFR